MDISGVGLRATRAALFSAVVVMLSAASHVLLSGAPLPPALVAGLATAVFLPAYALAGRERGFWPIAGLLVPLELAADTVFTAGQTVCYGPAGGPVSGPLRAMGLDLLCGGTPLGEPLARLAGVPGHAAAPLALPAAADPTTPWLLLALHVSVGLLASFWLWRGERALFGLGRALTALGAGALRPLLLAAASVRVRTGAVPVRRAVRARRAAAALRTRFPVHSVGLRGPPVPLLASS
ncbi:hypothetical protein [Streptomyces sp. NPDC097619]|uniref:hypothetical protein n=1 Tax=Streptomyces sp. NPDC097619 TaxID=3157228 RepID=UPI00331AD126